MNRIEIEQKLFKDILHSTQDHKLAKYLECFENLSAFGKMKFRDRIRAIFEKMCKEQK